MSEPKFTPGPLEVASPEKRMGGWECYVHAPHERPGGKLAAIAIGRDGAKAKANAYLIAAAPDLYAELANLVAIIENGDRATVASASYAAARAALSKARGE